MAHPHVLEKDGESDVVDVAVMIEIGEAQGFLGEEGKRAAFGQIEGSVPAALNCGRRIGHVLSQENSIRTLAAVAAGISTRPSAVVSARRLLAARQSCSACLFRTLMPMTAA